MPAALTEFPCLECSYNLFGLGDGRCPECGRKFLVKDLQPEEPNLPVEDWFLSADTKWKSLLLPLRIAVSPRKAFRRRCRLERILDVSPWRMVPYFVVLFLCLGTSVFLIEYFMWRRWWVTDFSNYLFLFSGQVQTRSISPLHAIVHLPLVWAQCAVLCVWAFFVGWRLLSFRQFANLATWMLPLTLVAAAASTAYSHCDSQFGLGQSIGRALEWIAYVGQAFTMSGPLWTTPAFIGLYVSVLFHDFILGIWVGLAAGAVVGRRRLVIAVSSVAMSIAIGCVGVTVESVFQYLFLAALHRAVDPPRTGPWLSADGPSFALDARAPTLAGQWEGEARYENGTFPFAIQIDDRGRIVRISGFRQVAGRNLDLQADGEEHHITIESSTATGFEYRCSAACSADDDLATIQVWYWLKQSLVNPAGMPTWSVVQEMILYGELGPDRSHIEGNVIIEDSRYQRDVAYRASFTLDLVSVPEERATQDP